MKFIKNVLIRLAIKKIISIDDVDTFENQFFENHISIENFLQKNKICSQEDYYSVLSDIYSIPFMDVETLDIDKELFNKFNLAYLKKKKMFPVCVDANGSLVIAVSNVIDVGLTTEITSNYSGDIKYILVLPKQVDSYINSIVAVKTTQRAVNDLEKDKTKKNKSENKNIEKQNKIDDVVNAPAVRLVDSFIKEAIPFRASDIHVEPYETEVKVRYRIDGDLTNRISFPISSYPAVCARLKIISGMNIAERRIPQDGRINMTINGVDYDFRVSTLPTVHGEKFVIRVLDKTSFNFTRKDLGFTPEENKIIDKILAYPHGLVLLTGPTGCGKSTTLYSFLKEVNKPDVNIVTVEDPVEYSMIGINQTQVNTKANMTFATALRSILRQDPDIIMIGEIRDEETAQIAIRAAITGHMVFSTLHTNDAPGAVTRLVDMGVNSYLVGDSVVGVISQRLVKRLCPMCKKQEITSQKQMDILGLDKPEKIYKAQGCQFCNGAGYKGRHAVHEIMYIDDSLRDIIDDGVSVEQIRDLAEKEGMISLRESCKNAVLNGDTSIQEFMVLNVCDKE